jgi:hypothetical protein
LFLGKTVKVVEDWLKRTLEHILGRMSGPMWLRIIIQPSVSVIIALRAGLRDAHAGQPPFGWAVLSGHTQRRTLLNQGWTDIARVFIASIVLDLIYQISVLRWIYPLQAVFVATLLASLPYGLTRGPANRLVKLWHSRREKRAPASQKNSPNLAVRK